MLATPVERLQGGLDEITKTRLPPVTADVPDPLHVDGSCARCQRGYGPLPYQRVLLPATASRYEGTMNETELDFMARLLEMDPAKRMTGEQALQHPYLADLALTGEPIEMPPMSAGSYNSNSSTTAPATPSHRSTDASGAAILLGSVLLGSQHSTRQGSPSTLQLDGGLGPGSYIPPGSVSGATGEGSQRGIVAELSQGGSRPQGSATGPLASARSSVRASAAGRGPSLADSGRGNTGTSVALHVMSGRRSAVGVSARSESGRQQQQQGGEQRGTSALQAGVAPPSASGRGASSRPGSAVNSPRGSLRVSASRASARLSSALVHASQQDAQ